MSTFYKKDFGKFSEILKKKKYDEGNLEHSILQIVGNISNHQKFINVCNNIECILERGDIDDRNKFKLSLLFDYKYLRYCEYSRNSKNDDMNFFEKYILSIKIINLDEIKWLRMWMPLYVYGLKLILWFYEKCSNNDFNIFF